MIKDCKTKKGVIMAGGGQWQHGARSNLHSGERLRSDCISADDICNSPTKIPPEFFVPSFSVFRPVLATLEMHDFHSRLGDLFGKGTYRALPLARMGVRIVEQKALIKIFHGADVKPYAEDIHDVVDHIKVGLGNLVKSKPHSFPMYTDTVYRFGEDGKSIALGSKGWQGFKARYPRKDALGNLLFNSQGLNEANLVIGALTNVFTEEYDTSGELQDVNFRPLQSSLAPHVTVAKKVRGNALTNSEVVELNGHISEFMPESIPLFDPFIRVRLDRDGTGVYLNSRDEEEKYDAFMTVRNPKKKEYGKLLLRYFND